jgi:hypothetical protein
MAIRHFKARRTAAAAIATAAIALQIVAVALAWRSSELSELRRFAYASDAFLWIPWTAIGAIIALRGVRTPGATMLALAIALLGLEHALGMVRLRLWPGNLLLFAINAAVALFAAGAYLRAAQLFPKQLTSQDFEGAAAWPRSRSGRTLLASLLRPWAAWAIAVVWFALTFVPIAAVGTFASIAVILLGAAYWYAHYRVGTPKARRRVMWVLQTASVFAMLYLIALAVNQLLDSSGAQALRPYVAIGYNLVAAVAACGSLMMAVFGAGAVNPSLVVRTTVAYGAAITMLLSLLNVIVSVLVDSAVGALGLSDRLISAIFGALAGLMLEPVANWLRFLLERRERAGGG